MLQWIGKKNDIDCFPLVLVLIHWTLLKIKKYLIILIVAHVKNSTTLA